MVSDLSCWSCHCLNVTRVTARTNNYDSRVFMREEYVRVVKLVRMLPLSLVAPVRILVVCQSKLGVAYIQLMIGNAN